MLRLITRPCDRRSEIDSGNILFGLRKLFKLGFPGSQIQQFQFGLVGIKGNVWTVV